MTIKQQGGIFGRNPTFNDVNATNVDTANVYANNISVGTDFQIEPVTLLRTTGNNASNPVIAGSAGAIDKYATIDVYRGGSSSQIGWTFNTYFGALAEAFTVKPSGNLAFPSGQGIDFSATAGTGTSELFDDYEEGTFNCTYSTTGTAFDSITMDATRTKGYYVKIGRAVHVQCTLRSDAVTVGSASGDLIITGLPFSAPSNSSGTGDGYASFAVSLTGGFASDHPFVLATRPGFSDLLVRKRTSVTAGDVAMVPSDMATGANANSITFSGTYYV